MKSFALVLSSVLFLGLGSAQANIPEASKRIAKAVKIFEKAALGGVSTYKLDPARTQNVKAALIALAFKTDAISEIEEFEADWVGSDRKAWETDSHYFGET